VVIEYFWFPSFSLADARRDLSKFQHGKVKPVNIWHGIAVTEVTRMKVLGVIQLAALSVLLGAALPAFAQDEHQKDGAKPGKQQQEKPAKQEEHAAPARSQEPARAPEHQQQATRAPDTQEAKPQDQAVNRDRQQPAGTIRPSRQEPAKAPQARAPQSQSREPHAERTSTEIQRQHSMPALRLSIRGSGRIPDDRFRANFGSSHRFVISQPQMVGGYSRFQYGGFWFGFVEPWPDGWYYTDDVYVDYIDGGYYLCNPYYPSDRVSISVVL
jgi:hypothetical protein